MAAQLAAGVIEYVTTPFFPSWWRPLAALRYCPKCRTRAQFYTDEDGMLVCIPCGLLLYPHRNVPPGAAANQR